MNKIGRPDLVPPNLLEQFQKSPAAKQERGDGIQGSVVKIGDGQQDGDRVEISANARKLEDMRRVFQQSKKALDAAPDVRSERLAQVRQRLQTGYYDSEEVRQTIASRLGAVLKRLDALTE